MSSRTRLTTIAKIAQKGELGEILIMLMMALNDLTLCNHSQGAWKDETDRLLQDRKTGAKMYFMRITIAHLFEAMAIIKRINDTDALRAYLENSDSRTRKSFDKTASFIGSPDYIRMLRIRNNLTFHYDGGPIKKAFRTSSDVLRNLNLEISLSSNLSEWHFDPANRIIDQIVVRQIFGIAAGADVREEVDKIVDRLLVVIEDFGDFAGYFIWKHATE